MNLANVPMGHPIFAEGRWGDAAWQHRAVMRLFGDVGGSRASLPTAQVLYRVEPEVSGHDGSQGRVLVQSVPDPAADGIRVTRLAPVIAAYAQGVTVRLLLRANTVRSINRTGADGKVRVHRARVPADRLDAWFRDRLSGAVDVRSPVLMEPGELRLGRAQLITTTFRADAEVSDPQRLRQLVQAGIGRGKAYGCGMLSALPVR